MQIRKNVVKIIKKKYIQDYFKNHFPNTSY